MDGITHETFSPHLNRVFLIPVEDGALELELTAVEVAEADGLPEGMRQPFTLVFQGDKSCRLPEGSYRFELGEGKALDIYLIPILSMGDRQSYQAVFN